MRAYVRQGDSSDSVDGCDDPSAKVRALSQNFPRNAQAADVLRGNLVMGLLKPLKGPFTELS